MSKIELLPMLELEPMIGPAGFGNAKHACESRYKDILARLEALKVQMHNEQHMDEQTFASWGMFGSLTLIAEKLNDCLEHFGVDVPD